MKQQRAKAEVNTGRKITIPVKTRTPLEAFQLLRQGQPIDVMAAHFAETDTLPSDFYMMDKTAKLHKLAELRELEAMHKSDMDYYQNEINLLNNQNNGQTSQVTETGTNPTL